jgi:hypothetical protein
MILSFAKGQGFRFRSRLCLVTGLIIALLAFPCGPVVTALAADSSHTHAAHAGTGHSEHGAAECSHHATKQESSCCKACSSWVAGRFADEAIPGSTLQHMPLAAMPVPVIYVATDHDPRLTGPPLIAWFDGSNIYLKHRRLRI